MPTGDPPYPNYKTSPSPPGPTGPDLSNPVSVELALRTWQHAAEYNKQNWQQAEDRYKKLSEEYKKLRELEELLDPFRPGPLFDGSIRLRLSLRESLHQLADLFVNKYPSEDAEIVQNLVKIFIEPVEQKLEASDDPSVPTAASPR